MPGSEYPLSLIIKAVDKATAPLREVNKRMAALTAPVRKLNNSFRALSAEAGLPKLVHGVVHGVKGVGESFGHVFHAAEGLVMKLLTVEAVGGFAMYEIVKSATEAGEALGKAARRTGFGVDEFARLRFAAQAAGVEQEEFTSAIDQFNKRLGEAKAGGGPLLAFLQRVSPALAAQVKGAKSTGAALILMQGAFEKVRDPAQRAALQAAAFGRASREMGGWLGQGRKATEAAARQYDEMAGSQEGLVEGSEKMHHAAVLVSAAFEGLRAAALGPLLPVLADVAHALAGILAGNRAKIAAWARETGAALSAWVKGGGLERLVKSLGNFVQILGRAIDMVGGLKGVLVIVGTYLAGGFIGSVFGAIGALWKLGAAVLPMLVRGLMLLWPALTSVGAAIAPLAVAAAPFVAALLGIGASGYAIYRNWSDIVEVFTTWSGYLNMIKAQLDMIIHPLESLKTAGQWWGKTLFGSTPTPGPMHAAAPTAPGAAGGGSGSVRVQVDFANAPRGTRVTADPQSTADIDYSMGYSMAVP